MLAAVLVIFMMLAFFRASITGWVLAIMVIVPVVAIQSRIPDTALQAVYSVLFLFIMLFGVPLLRRNIISGTILKIFRNIQSDPEIIGQSLLRPLEFADNTFYAVYHSHLLEHLPKRYVPVFLQECWRVLKPGGILRVVVPDLESA